jgi:hypothetical protein
MNVTIENEPVVTLTMTIREAAALAAAARNFVEAREHMIQVCGSGTVNLKKAAREDLERVGMGLTKALGYPASESVWDYANIDRPSQPTPEATPDEDDDD